MVKEEGTVERQVKVLIKYNSAVGNFSPKTEGTKTKAARCIFLHCQVCLLVTETAEINTGMAEKSSWDQANIRTAKTRFGLEK